MVKMHMDDEKGDPGKVKDYTVITMSSYRNIKFLYCSQYIVPKVSY